MPYAEDAYRADYLELTTPYEVDSLTKTDGFEAAVLAEYGVSLEKICFAAADLVDLATENKAVVFSTTIKQIATLLTEKTEYTPDEVKYFINAFSLKSREKWDEVLSPWRKSDIYPWLYDRKLSNVSRPFFLLGNDEESEVIYGMDSMLSGITQTLEKIKAGHFPTERFHSSEMKSYIGRVANKMGNAFTAQVDALVRSNDWSTEIELDVSTLGGPAKLGDLDVVAYDTAGRVFVLECKRLSRPRNAFEVSTQIDRFKGSGTGDLLLKHINRVNWLRENFESLEEYLKIKLNINKLEHRIVTNRIAPLKYVGIEGINPNLFITFDEILNKSNLGN
jgi:hypothetical protein